LRLLSNKFATFKSNSSSILQDLSLGIKKARALYENSNTIVFDEATSAIDTATEN